MAYARGLCQGYPLMPSLKVSIPCKGSCLIKSFLLMFEILHSMISTHECFFSSISVWIREDEKKQSRGEMPSFAYRRRQEILALKVYSVSYSSRFFYCALCFRLLGDSEFNTTLDPMLFLSNQDNARSLQMLLSSMYLAYEGAHISVCSFTKKTKIGINPRSIALICLRNHHSFGLNKLKFLVSDVELFF